MSKNAAGKDKEILIGKSDELKSRAQDAGIGGITIGVTEVTPRRKASQSKVSKKIRPRKMGG